MLLEYFILVVVRSSFDRINYVFITIKKRASAEIVEKKSRFIASAAHVVSEEEAIAFIEETRATHRLARHNVYAYVLRASGRTRYSDDGEPAKTAGLPTLETITHAELTDVAVVVTRYFGGTLLGTGGLVRAYTKAVQEVLASAEKISYFSCIDVTMIISYSSYERVMRGIQTSESKLVNAYFEDNVTLNFLVKEDCITVFLARMISITNGQLTLEQGAPYFEAFENSRSDSSSS